MQFYTDVTRESDAWALPDVETFKLSYQDFLCAEPDSWMRDAMDNECCSNFQNAAHLKGWYWWTCFPGCMPDSDAFGPFDTEKLAIEDAREVI